eukprot:g37399.t1
MALRQFLEKQQDYKHRDNCDVTMTSCYIKATMQGQWTGKGTRMGPSYACLFVGYMEYSLFQSYSGLHPQFFLWYIDAASLSHLELESERVPLVLTYRPTSIHIQEIIKRHFRHLQQDATTGHIFPFPSLSAFHRDHYLWDTSSNFLQSQHLLTQPDDTFPCNRRR